MPHTQKRLKTIEGGIIPDSDSTLSLSLSLTHSLTLSLTHSLTLSLSLFCPYNRGTSPRRSWRQTGFEGLGLVGVGADEDHVGIHALILSEGPRIGGDS